MDSDRSLSTADTTTDLTALVRTVVMLAVTNVSGQYNQRKNREGTRLVIGELAAWVREHPAGAVLTATFDGFNLSVGGVDWGLGSTSPWRLVKNGDLAAASSDLAPACGALETLVGDVLVDVEAQSSRMCGDPALVFASGACLEIFSDTQIDPWTFQRPGMIYVGTPGDMRYNR